MRRTSSLFCPTGRTKRCLHAPGQHFGFDFGFGFGFSREMRVLCDIFLCERAAARRAPAHLERQTKRLNSLTAVRPAFLEEYERMEAARGAHGAHGNHAA